MTKGFQPEKSKRDKKKYNYQRFVLWLNEQEHAYLLQMSRNHQKSPTVLIKDTITQWLNGLVLSNQLSLFSPEIHRQESILIPFIRKYLLNMHNDEDISLQDVSIILGISTDELKNKLN